MTGGEFREGHGDPKTWDDDEYEAYFAWTAKPDTCTCWFCGSDDNPARATTCGFCQHSFADGPHTPDHQTAA